MVRHLKRLAHHPHHPEKQLKIRSCRIFVHLSSLDILKKCIYSKHIDIWIPSPRRTQCGYRFEAFSDSWSHLDCEHGCCRVTQRCWEEPVSTPGRGDTRWALGYIQLVRDPSGMALSLRVCVCSLYAKWLPEEQWSRLSRSYQAYPWHSG